MNRSQMVKNKIQLVSILTWILLIVFIQGCSNYHNLKQEPNCMQDHNDKKLKFWIDSFEYNSTSKEINFTTYFENVSSGSYYVYLGDLYSDWVNHQFSLKNSNFSQLDNKLLSIGAELSPPITMPEDYLPPSLNKIYTLIKMHGKYKYSTVYQVNEKQEKYILNHSKIGIDWLYGDNINNRLDGIYKRYQFEEENISKVYLKDYDTSICLWQGQQEVTVICTRDSIDKGIYRFKCVKQ